MNKYPETDRLRAIEMVRNGATYAHAAEEVGCYPRTVAVWCRAEGLHPKRGRRKKGMEQRPPSEYGAKPPHGRKAYLAKLLHDAFPEIVARVQARRKAMGL